MTNTAFQQRIAERLQQLRQNDLLRTPTTVSPQPNGYCTVNGRQLINFGSNDYLNLAFDRSVCDAFQSVAAQQTGSTASAMTAGRSPHHARLESELAEFEAVDSALLFPTGYAANLGIINALVEQGDAVFCDRENHASLIDGSRICDGSLLVYRRSQLDRLQASLSKRRSEYNQVFIVTDGVFSMDGSIAPLQELCELARQFDAQVIVDEAHGTGVLGEHGRGASEHAHVEDQVLLRIGTMSKAMGGLGGFVATDATTADWLRNSARTQFFSTALPPAVCAAMCASLKLITDEPQRRQQLLRNTQFAHQTLQNLGLQTIGSGPAPIIAVLMPGDKAAVQVAAELQDQGWFVPAIRPPTVPQGSSRLRISLSSAHTQQQIANLGEAIVPLLSKC